MLEQEEDATNLWPQPEVRQTRRRFPAGEHLEVQRPEPERNLLEDGVETSCYAADF